MAPSFTRCTWNLKPPCIKKNVGGQKGWRLPSVVELTSLIDPNATADPFLPVNHPFTNLQPTLINWFWSATTYAPDPAVVWMVVFPDGSVTTGFKTSSSRPWCVRGGMNADQY